ncbi:ImmA/IrrE family metallo-endopeptidase [uncultured Catenibacterium sp.]|uniref:ImmA/IrrE family metallo-endopeptidase n=1 Tax=uncultured Catenibacterium sp. TaxID=286142 RepID=UPI002605B285|nr:ImmA/IrrE family metallo-endopeptidase [uncultured Catenibacterium sp.]
MCIEIENYKQHDLFNYFDYNQIDTEELLNTLLNNPEYSLKLNKRRVPVMEIAKVLGFTIYTTKFNNYNVKATIGISNQLINKYKSDKVIILSNEYTDEEILFSLCYELAHYIYDSNPSDEYSHTYRINDIEPRTIRFADALLMPLTSFKEAYTELSHNINDLELLIRALSDTFNASQVAVQRRLKQVINTKL